MRLITVLFISFIFLTRLLGQNIKISGKVIDIENNEELPYASLMIIGHTIGTSSDIHGKFEFIISDSLRNDSIIISYVGYTPGILSLTNFKQNTSIKLKPQNTILKEIVVRPSNKKVKPLFVNQFKQKDCEVRYSSVNTNMNRWIPSRPKEPTIEAIFFPNKAEYNQTKRVKEVWLQVTNYKTPPTYFNLHIYSVNNDQRPDRDLLSESIIIKVTETSKLIKVNLEKYNILIPEQGLFVGFELLIIDENKNIISDQKGAFITLY